MLKKLVLIFTAVIILLLIHANWPISSVPDNLSIDKIIVEKQDRKLILLKNNHPLKTYSIALGKNPIGHKQKEGDNKTPEGIYVIDYKNNKSTFHRSIHISYPSHRDILEAESNGFNPGGMIMIHGIKNGLGFIGRLHRLFDWTAGCIAVTNPEIEQIWQLTPVGTTIEINP